MPRVTIGIPVYNGEVFLEETLQSILAQTYKDFLVIISDNGSTDGTQEMCRRYAAQDSRIQYIREEINRGATWNYNRLVPLATTPYFKWAAHDDCLAPTYLEKCVAILDAHPDVVLCHTDDQDIDAQGKPADERRRVSHIPSHVRGMYPRPSQRYRRLLRDDHDVEAIFGVIRLDALLKTRLIQSYADSDRTCLVQLGMFGKVYEIQERLFLHRHHSMSSGRANPINEGWYARVGWFDPALQGKALMSRWRQLGEYHRIIPTAPISLKEKLLCVFWLYAAYSKKAKYLARELNAALKKKTYQTLHKVQQPSPSHPARDAGRTT